MSSVLQKPAFAHISIIHAGTIYSVDNDLVEADVTLSADSRSGNLDLIVRNDTGQYGIPTSSIFQPGDSVITTLYKGTSPTTTGLVVYWPLDSGAGTVAADASGNNVNLSLNGTPDWVAGKFGHGVIFNSGKYATAPDNLVLRLTTAFTLAAWVWLVSAPVNYSGVIERKPGTGQSTYDYFLQILNNRSIQYGFYDSTNTIRIFNYAASLSTGAWHHIAATYNGSNIILYIDGAQVKTNSQTGTIRTTTGSKLFCADGYGANQSMILDEIRIYNRALSGTEITTLATSIPPFAVFKGWLQRPRYVKEYGGANKKFMRFNAIDGSGILQARYANTAFQTFQATDPGFKVSDIVTALVTDPANLMDNQSGITTAGLGITTNGVQDIPVYIRNIVFSQQSVFSCLSQLAQYANANFYVDSNLDLHFFQVQSITSPVILDDTMLIRLDIEDDGTDIKNVVAVNGSNVDLPGDSQQDVSGGAVTTYNQYNAVQFTAGNFNLDIINLYLQKVQSSGLIPVANLNGEIYTDNVGTLQGGLQVATFQLTNNMVSTDPTWIPVNVTATLVPGNKYWVRLDKAGQDANNYYLWSYGAATGSRPYATSANGTSWTVYSAGNAPAFQVLYAAGILHISHDDVSIAAYGYPRDTTITDLTLPTFKAATDLGNAYLGLGSSNWGVAKKKRFLRIESFVPDTPINPGENVQVIDSDYGINHYYTAIQIQYVIKGLECTNISLQLQEFLY